MAVKARYTAPLQVVATDELRDRIKKIADAEEISQAQVIREILEAGIAKREGRGIYHNVRVTSEDIGEGALHLLTPNPPAEVRLV